MSTHDSTTKRARIRAAGPWDASTLAHLHSRTWRESFADLVPEQVIADHAANAPGAWERRLADPASAAYWVAEREGEMVGFSWVESTGPGQVRPLELVGLYVVADHHGTGVADDLLTCAVGTAPCFCWVARENNRARAFYQRHGLRPDGATEVVPQWGDLPLVRLVR